MPPRSIIPSQGAFPNVDVRCREQSVAGPHAPQPGDFLSAEYFTIEQLARALNKSVRTLLRWDNLRNGPPCTRVGNLRLFRKSTLEKWLKAREEPEVARKRRA